MVVTILMMATLSPLASTRMEQVYPFQRLMNLRHKKESIQILLISMEIRLL